MERPNKSQTIWHIIFSFFYLFLVFFTINYLNFLGKLTKNISSFDVIILILATYRLIRLFTFDTVTDFLRIYFGRFESGPKREIDMLLNCPWCTGIWMALIVFFLYFSYPLFWYFLFILALAGAGSFIQIVIWRIGRE